MIKSLFFATSPGEVLIFHEKVLIFKGVAKIFNVFNKSIFYPLKKKKKIEELSTFLVAEPCPSTSINYQQLSQVKNPD